MINTYGDQQNIWKLLTLASVFINNSIVFAINRSHIIVVHCTVKKKERKHGKHFGLQYVE